MAWTAGMMIYTVEKQALEGVLVPVCRLLDVPFSANKGYSSASRFCDASRRMIHALEHGREVHVLYLGHHDLYGDIPVEALREFFS